MNLLLVTTFGAATFMLMSIPEAAGLFVIGIALVMAVILIRRITVGASIDEKNEELEKKV